VINVPPRHLKSITTSVAYVAYLLGHDPGCKVIVASYGLDLGRKHAADCRRVMASGWYRALFPETRLAATGNTQDEIRTTRGGGRKAVSVGGAVTGHGCDVLIIDDLVKAGDADSETEIVRAQDFIDGSLLSRFDNPAEGRVVCIQQRLHEMDPAGYLLSRGTYRHLNLPAIAEAEETIPLGGGRVHRRKVGDLLCPARLSREDLDALRREMGSAVFAMQYQQDPIAPDGSALRWEWFRQYDAVLPRHRYELVVQSWDTSMSADPRSDFSVCTTWGFLEAKWRLLDVFRDRLNYPDLLRKALALCDEWLPDLVLIEKAASGIPLLHDCWEARRRNLFRAITPDKDKQVRFNAACAPVEVGNLLLPRDAPWLAEFRRELLGFPRARFDDQVDSFSQFVNWSKSPEFWRKLDRNHPLRQERQQRRAPRRISMNRR
jgi:predicted phage terminase large subunit-like protein